MPGEMKRFVEWFNGSRNFKGAVLAGVAHPLFGRIRPLDDGNGRVGRAMADIALPQELVRPALLRLSATIQGKVQDYYDALDRAGRRGMDITEWLAWFTGLVLDSRRRAREDVGYVLATARFWDVHGDKFNGRQARGPARTLRVGATVSRAA